MSKKIDNGIINIAIYIGMLVRAIKRYPKLALATTMLAFGGYCVLHAFTLQGNKPFFSITGIACTLVATPLILFYEKEDKPRNRRRPDILSTDNDWFSERELA